MSKIYGYNVNTKRTHLVKDYMPNKRRKSKCDAIKWYIYHNLFSIRIEDQWIFDFMRRVCSSFGRWFFWFFILCYQYYLSWIYAHDGVWQQRKPCVHLFNQFCGEASFFRCLNWNFWFGQHIFFFDLSLVNLPNRMKSLSNWKRVLF